MILATVIPLKLTVFFFFVKSLSLVILGKVQEKQIFIKSCFWVLLPADGVTFLSLQFQHIDFYVFELPNPYRQNSVTEIQLQFKLMMYFGTKSWWHVLFVSEALHHTERGNVVEESSTLKNVFHSFRNILNLLKLEFGHDLLFYFKNI